MTITVKGYRKLELVNAQQEQMIESLKRELSGITGELEVLEEISNVLESIIKILEK